MEKKQIENGKGEQVKNQDQDKTITKYEQNGDEEKYIIQYQCITKRFVSYRRQMLRFIFLTRKNNEKKAGKQ